MLSYNQKTDALGGIKPDCVTYAAHEVQACAVLSKRLSVVRYGVFFCLTAVENPTSFHSTKRHPVWLSSLVVRVYHCICRDAAKPGPKSVLLSAKGCTGTHSSLILLVASHRLRSRLLLMFQIYHKYREHFLFGSHCPCPDHCSHLLLSKQLALLYHILMVFVCITFNDVHCHKF